jgi:hypothetical protein
MLKNKIKITISFVCNFKPLIGDITDLELNIFKPIKNNKQVVCRNFFLFFLFLKNVSGKNNNISIYIKPRKQGFSTILRAPYRYKLGRYQVGYSRYYTLISLNLKVSTKLKKNFYEITDFLKISKLYYSSLDSNLLNQFKIKMEFYNVFTDFFKIKNYKVL